MFGDAWVDPIFLNHAPALQGNVLARYGFYLPLGEVNFLPAYTIAYIGGGPSICEPVRVDI